MGLSTLNTDESALRPSVLAFTVASLSFELLRSNGLGFRVVKLKLSTPNAGDTEFGLRP